MGMPLANKREDASTLPPSLPGKILMPRILTVESESRAAVASERLRAFCDFDMGTTIAADQDPSSLRRVLGDARVTIYLL